MIRSIRFTLYFLHPLHLLSLPLLRRILMILTGITVNTSLEYAPVTVGGETTKCDACNTEGREESSLANVVDCSRLIYAPVEAIEGADVRGLIGNGGANRINMNPPPGAPSDDASNEEKNASEKDVYIDIPENAEEVISGWFEKHKVKGSTEASYRPHWKTWNEFLLNVLKCDDPYLEKLDMDRQVIVWTLFLRHLYLEHDLRDEELTQVLAGVKHYFDVAMKSVTALSSSIVKTAKKCTKRSTSEAREHSLYVLSRALTPLCDEVVADIVKTNWDEQEWDTSTERRGTLEKTSAAAIMFALFVGLRVSNYTMVQPNKEDHCVKSEDFTMETDEGGNTKKLKPYELQGVDKTSVDRVAANVHTTKTGETEKTQVTKIIDRSTPEGSDLIDKLVETFQHNGVKGPGEDAFNMYRPVRGGKLVKSGLQRKGVADLLKDSQSRCNVNGRVSTHSVRITYATREASKDTGISSAALAMGGWKEGARGGSRTVAGHYAYQGVGHDGKISKSYVSALGKTNPLPKKKKTNVKKGKKTSKKGKGGRVELSPVVKSSKRAQA